MNKTDKSVTDPRTVAGEYNSPRDTPAYNRNYQRAYLDGRRLKLNDDCGFAYRVADLIVETGEAYAVAFNSILCDWKA